TRAETPRTNRAVSRTAREVLRFGGAVARTYYSSTSGGRTQGIPGVPYLRSVADPYDTISPHHRWGPLRYSGTRLGRLLHVPAPTAVHVARNGFGRATSVYLRWHGGGSKLDASAFEKRLGLFSTWFWVGKVGKVGASHRAAAAPARATHRRRRSEAARPRQRRRPRRAGGRRARCPLARRHGRALRLRRARRSRAARPPRSPPRSCSPGRAPLPEGRGRAPALPGTRRLPRGRSRRPSAPPRRSPRGGSR